jgi:hypothetical protein
MTQNKVVQLVLEDIKKREKSWQEIDWERLWEARRDGNFVPIDSYKM